MNGLELLRGIIAGEVPPAPISAVMGFDLHEVEEGRAVFRAVPTPALNNPMGTVHGGLVMTLIDSACGCAVHSTLPEGAFYGTLETKVNMVRAVTRDTGPLLCTGELVHRGGKVATAEARVVGEADGKLYAHGTSTCLIQALAS